MGIVVRRASVIGAHRPSGRLAVWKVRALLLGAQASVNARPGWLHRLLGSILDEEAGLGNQGEPTVDIDLIVALWSELLEDRRLGKVRLSDVPLHAPARIADLTALARRRAEEIGWFMQGMAPVGSLPADVPAERRYLSCRLEEARLFYDGYGKMLSVYEDRQDRDLSSVIEGLGALALAVEVLIGRLLDTAAFTIDPARDRSCNGPVLAAATAAESAIRPAITEAPDEIDAGDITRRPSSSSGRVERASRTARHNLCQPRGRRRYI